MCGRANDHLRTLYYMQQSLEILLGQRSLIGFFYNQNVRTDSATLLLLLFQHFLEFLKTFVDFPKVV